MAGLSKETEQDIEKYYQKDNGFLINISERKEAYRISVVIKNYCMNTCPIRCQSSAPAIGLGEINKDLVGSGLYSTGLFPESENVIDCPLYDKFNPTEIEG